MLIVAFPADTVIYLPRKFENLGGGGWGVEKHCIFYSNKMFFMTLTTALTAMVSLLLVRVLQSCPGMPPIVTTKQNKRSELMP